MTGGNLHIAFVFIQATALIVAVILCILLLNKAKNVYVRNKKKKITLKYEPYFFYIQALLNGNSGLPVPAERLRGLERRVIQLKLTDWMDHVEGSHRDKLGVLCEEIGLVDWNLAKLRSIRSIRKLEAVYHLGSMRSRRAVPYLLGELGKQKFGVPLFIIARALAKSARDGKDMEQVIRHIVKHRKPVHRLAADIIEDSGIDTAELLDRLIMDSNPDIVRIALNCLENKVCTHLLPKLTDLSQTDNKEIRSQAVKILLNSNSRISETFIGSSASLGNEVFTVLNEATEQTASQTI